MPDEVYRIPETTDEDIEWVCSLMGLEALDEPRRIFLKSCRSLDVSACPGSGKTTLIVAKLAILARKWPHQTKGVCVLSHTNVAREEIQSRLGSTVIGHRLLSYPHFIDTIHGFVNRFLALPWLNSRGYPSPTIDNDVTTAYRRSLISNEEYWTVENLLRKKYSSFDHLRISKSDLSFDLGGKVFPAGVHATSFGIAKRSIEGAARAGYFCHDEMFVWARALLEDCPDVTSWLRHRFPLVIVDEMQDTSKLQGSMLSAVFPRSLSEVVVQRVGDPNQAIFDNADAEPSEEDPFPDPEPARNLGIPNSYRFGQEIATLASPLAVTTVGPAGLRGVGPKAIPGKPPVGRHAVFIFPESSTATVLDVYGKHVLGAFDDRALAAGSVTAVGAVHQEATGIASGHRHFPKSVPHYWSGYTAEIARKEPHPRSLLQYVRAAHAAISAGQDLAPAVERVASGVIRMAGQIGEVGKLKRKARTHRAIVEALSGDSNSLAKYRQLIRALLVDRVPLTEENWLNMQSDFVAVSRALCDGLVVESNATHFIAWSADRAPDSANAAELEPNIYQVMVGGRQVDIHLGSIHSVKGQTHLSTLLLSTYWHDHSAKRMLPWIIGERENAQASTGSQDRKRLLQTYVAMTRPSHMVCLAVPRFVFKGDADLARKISLLRGHGWQVAEIRDEECLWHD